MPKIDNERKRCILGININGLYGHFVREFAVYIDNIFFISTFIGLL